MEATAAPKITAKKGGAVEMSGQVIGRWTYRYLADLSCEYRAYNLDGDLVASGKTRKTVLAALVAR